MNELNVMEIQQVLGGGSFRLRMTTSESGDVECALSYLHYTSVGSCTFSTIASAKPPLKIDPFLYTIIDSQKFMGSGVRREIARCISGAYLKPG